MIDGWYYTTYYAKQLMRQLETKIRRQKDVATIAKASGDDVLRRQAQKKITDYTAAYERVSDASGLETRYERTFVGGFKDIKATSLQETLNISFPEISGVVPKGATIEGERVIAGLGNKTEIRDIGYLVNELSGSELQWSKVDGIISTDYFDYDVHWHERQGVQYKTKIVHVRKKV